uniref:Fungal lipase-type domain-containing protein n=1 Tax=Kalanchoe fedtschenkoi TaxID=63787 RepID=A0A7N0TFS5_KALFE
MSACCAGSSAGCNKGFAADYMLLDPAKLSVMDLYHILFSSDIENRHSVDSSAAREDDINRRWIIFISMVAQKILQLVSKPLSKFGSGIEYWINLVSSNGSLLKLVINFVRDYQGKFTTQAFLLHDKRSDPDVVVVSFRGTETFDADAWCSDFDISWYAIPGMGNIHGGFMKALGLVKSHGWPKEVEDGGPPLAYYEIRKMLREILRKNEKTQIIITGHSLGGALAILFPSVLALHEEDSMLDRLSAIYTFGQPRVGDENFGTYMEKIFEKHDIQYFRFVYNYDIVPRLPYDDASLMFKHFGTCIFFDSNYEAKIVEEEPNKNYFSPRYFIPKTISSCWELARSFIIHYMKGPAYAEGSLCRFFRVVGLMVIGVPNHMPQDYVNSTRLAAPHIFPLCRKEILQSKNGSSTRLVKKDD